LDRDDVDNEVFELLFQTIPKMHRIVSM